ncbi:MAG TPA: hypothetical protein VF271_05295 [Rhodanobacteraceae bacterium]
MFPVAGINDGGIVCQSIQRQKAGSGASWCAMALSLADAFAIGLMHVNSGTSTRWSVVEGRLRAMAYVGLWQGPFARRRAPTQTSKDLAMPVGARLRVMA